MPDELGPQESTPTESTPTLVPADRSGDSLATPTRPTSVGRVPSTYEGTDKSGWKHWPLPVLDQLRDMGVAPSQMNIGTAGLPKVSRRIDGSHYEEKRAGWYLGKDANYRSVFVKIFASRPLQPLDPEGRQLQPTGSWTARTQTWELGDGLQRSWTSLVEQLKDSTDDGLNAINRERSANSIAQTTRIPMPRRFIHCLQGVPEEMQRFVLVTAGVNFNLKPWGDSFASGYEDCVDRCSSVHDDSCETIGIVAMDHRRLVALDAERFQHVWKAKAFRFTIRGEKSTLPVPV